MMSNRAFSSRGSNASGSAMQECLLVLCVFTMGICGCSSKDIHLPQLAQMPWTQTKPAATTPSPYAPVPIGPPSLPPPPANTGQYGNSIDWVVASVDGNPITRFDIQNTPTNPATGNNPADGANPNSKLKELIAQELLDEESQKFADRVDESDVDRFIRAIEVRNHVTDEQLRAQLQANGISYEAFRKHAFKQVEEIEMVQREVREKIQVPDSDVKAYYKSHPEEFTITQEKYRLAQILIAVPAGAPPDKVAAAQKKAEEVRTMAMKGKDFGELAWQYSDDDSKTKGGELGEFNPADLNDQIAAAVKQTKTGGIAPLVHTHYGFHIIKVEEHQKPGELPLAAVKDQIHDKLVNEQAKGRFEQWVEQDLAKQHDIETLN
jgi:peptidyl-prolyl cis-trans isomerase SurA